VVAEGLPGLPELLARIIEGEGLGFEEARRVADAMLGGGLDDLDIAALLVAMRARGETSDEVAGFAASLRSHCLRVNAPPDALDTAGTGGDRSHTLNASTAAALVAAAAGVVVAKHGNRSVSSRSGSADFLEALGYRVEHGPAEAECMLRRAGFVFLYAPRYHPAMKRVMPVRRRLGIRTVFNLVGPLSNPAMVRRQVLGVASAGLASVMVEAARRLGYERLVLVHGLPGIDEVSVSGDTLVYLMEGGRVERFTVRPEQLGLERHGLEELRVSSARESAERFLAVARGAGRRADRDFIAANAGAALLAAGRVSSLEEGVSEALELLGSGAVAEKLEEVLAACRECCGGEPRG